MADTKQQKPPFPLRALAAFAVTLAALFVLLLAAYALPGGSGAGPRLRIRADHRR